MTDDRPLARLAVGVTTDWTLDAGGWRAAQTDRIESGSGEAFSDYVETEHYLYEDAYPENTIISDTTQTGSVHWGNDYINRLVSTTDTSGVLSATGTGERHGYGQGTTTLDEIDSPGYSYHSQDSYDLSVDAPQTFSLTGVTPDQPLPITNHQTGSYELSGPDGSDSSSYDTTVSQNWFSGQAYQLGYYGDSYYGSDVPNPFGVSIDTGYHSNGQTLPSTPTGTPPSPGVLPNGNPNAPAEPTVALPAPWAPPTKWKLPAGIGPYKLFTDAQPLPDGKVKLTFSLKYQMGFDQNGEAAYMHLDKISLTTDLARAAKLRQNLIDDTVDLASLEEAANNYDAAVKRFRVAGAGIILIAGGAKIAPGVVNTATNAAKFALANARVVAGGISGIISGTATHPEEAEELFSTGERGAEVASEELLGAVRDHGRTITYALPGSDELRYLDSIPANANVGGPLADNILLREDARKIELLEEFLHGTQNKIGMINQLGNPDLEIHVKEFMINHSQLLGISAQDTETLQNMLKALQEQ